LYSKGAKGFSDIIHLCNKFFFLLFLKAGSVNSTL
jgi:hypothetical protein